jgi:hypothetical protein
MVSTGPEDLPDEDVASLLSVASRESDGVASLHDVQEESGDEAGVRDTYDMDDREARELGIQLDARDEPEPDLE